MWRCAVLTRSRLHLAVHATGRFISGAPLTFCWLALLLITTAIQHTLTGPQLYELLLRGSTNLHHLAADPVRVLFSSLLWIDGRVLWPYALAFCVFLAPVEHWLGHLRWLLVGLIAHVIATYVGEGSLYLAIQDAEVSPRLINARDIGVSYFVLGMVGVLTYRIARPWRWAYLLFFLATVSAALVLTPAFTSIGHFSALLVGLACYPLTLGRRRPAPTPAAYTADLWH